MTRPRAVTAQARNRPRARTAPRTLGAAACQDGLLAPKELLSSGTRSLSLYAPLYKHDEGNHTNRYTNDVCISVPKEYNK
jgi:hypothetical protein